MRRLLNTSQAIEALGQKTPVDRAECPASLRCQREVTDFTATRSWGRRDEIPAIVPFYVRISVDPCCIAQMLHSLMPCRAWSPSASPSKSVCTFHRALPGPYDGAAPSFDRRTFLLCGRCTENCFTVLFLAYQAQTPNLTKFRCVFSRVCCFSLSQGVLNRNCTGVLFLVM